MSATSLTKAIADVKSRSLYVLVIASPSRLHPGRSVSRSVGSIDSSSVQAPVTVPITAVTLIRQERQLPPALALPLDRRGDRGPAELTSLIVKAPAAPHPLGSRALPPARARPAGALGHARCREDRRRIVPGLERDLAHPPPGRSSWRDLLLAARHLGGPGPGVLDATP